MPPCYTVTVTDPHEHRFALRLEVADYEGGEFRVEFPTWTPGSYLIREYVRHVRNVTLTIAGQPQVFTKVAKGSWNATDLPAGPLVLTYTVYAFELTVRTSYLDADQGLLIPASTFFEIQGHQGPYQVRLAIPADWSSHTGLRAIDGGWEADDIHDLIDSPFQMGRALQVFDFMVKGVPHQLVVKGGSFPDQAVKDLTRICESTGEMYGTMPFDRYLFMLIMSEAGWGGLEHRFSSVNMAPHKVLQDPAEYEHLMTLLAHEYFHCWNVKRVFPTTLRDFDYTQEHHTRALWLMEGGTAYFEKLITRRAGLFTEDGFLASFAKLIKRYRQAPGRLEMSATESSFDAWISLYRPDEESPNHAISYYTKGALICWLLDLTIRARTDGKRSMTDFMVWLYQEHHTIGFDEDNLLQLLDECTGLSLATEYAAWVEGVAELPFEEVLAAVGLELEEKTTKEGQGPIDSTLPATAKGAWLGVVAKEDGTIKTVFAGSPARGAGIQARDRLVAIDGYRVHSKARLSTVEKHSEVGRRVRVHVFRDEVLRKFDLELAPQPPEWELKITDGSLGKAWAAASWREAEGSRQG